MRTRTIPGLVAAAIVLLLLAAPTAWAQLAKLKNTTPEQRAKALTEFMKSKLSLTTDQLPKVADLNLKYARKMEPVIKGSEGPLMKMRQAEEINHEKQAELKQILSPQQFDTYLASKEEMRERIEEKLEEKAKDAE